MALGMQLACDPESGCQPGPWHVSWSGNGFVSGFCGCPLCTAGGLCGLSPSNRLNRCLLFHFDFGYRPRCHCPRSLRGIPSPLLMCLYVAAADFAAAAVLLPCLKTQTIHLSPCPFIFHSTRFESIACTMMAMAFIRCYCESAPKIPLYGFFEIRPSTQAGYMALKSRLWSSNFMI
uniref:HDC14592 n=1 Tax=Drosophila melanogaster TaxID=7227 RepID=Q6IJN0_DROME|nr:TPA_inf: HDC14592 [Drosophila melanogaster]